MAVDMRDDAVTFGGDVFEHTVRFAQAQVFRPAERVYLRALPRSPRKLIQAVRIADVERPQDECVEHRKDGRVEPVAERKRADDRRGEGGRAADVAQRVTDVLPNGVEHVDTSRLPNA